MEIARLHLSPAELRELLAQDPTAVVEIGGEAADADLLRKLLQEPVATVDEPYYHEGSRNQRRVVKKLMRKAAKANKRR